MNKKSIAALAIAATMTLGVGASSYAWFTSKAESVSNTVETGKLSVSVAAPGFGETTPIIISNAQPGDESGTYTFTVTNNGTLPLRGYLKLIPDTTVENYNADLATHIQIEGFSLKKNEITVPSVVISDGKTLAQAEAMLPALENQGLVMQPNDFYTVSLKFKLNENTGNEMQNKGYGLKLGVYTTQNRADAAADLISRITNGSVPDNATN
jgi:predicted ribosomally synthesized peptide with SipW-like signal peptide